MKSFSWQKIVVVLTILAVLVVALWYAYRSEKTIEETVSVDPAFAQYISAYTTGVISSSTPQRIVFVHDVVDSSHIGRSAQEKLFRFSPAIAGTAVWVDARTIEFRPKDRMPAGTVYTAEFSLSDVIDEVADPLRTFRYSFRTMPQNYEIEVVNVRSYAPTDLTRQKIEGNFQTADYAKGERVERTLRALQAGKPLTVTWTHTEDGRQHQFVVENVVRGSDRGNVLLRVEGSPIAVDRSSEVRVDVTPLDEFELTKVRVVHAPSQYVVLQFSDPIQENQNLRGIISIDGLSDLDFSIHDNEIRVYPPVRQDGARTLILSPGIRNTLGKRFEQTLRREVTFEQVKPAVRFVGKGSILPSTDGLVLPFEAVNLNAVDVQVVRIYEDNALRFFQVNDIGGNNELRRVGNRIHKEKVSLGETGTTEPGKWNRYTLDISRMIQPEPGAIYQVKLSFRKSYSTFGCAATASETDMSLLTESFDDSYEGGYAYDSYDDYYYPPNYDWRERDNPCHDSYYTNNRNTYRNILASDIGLIVKRGTAGQTHVFVTDLKSAKPVPGVEVSLYSYQLRLLETARTDPQGKVVLSPDETPFAVVARNGTQRAYLRLVNGEALNVSNFDVSGQKVDRGLKGFLYGERGVWRPGDSLHLHFILNDAESTLPAHHPVVFELSDPNGQVIQRMVQSSSQNGFYTFATATGRDAPTGNWLGRVRVGGATFTETLKIETVKPNRLKIDLDFGVDKFTSPDLRGTLQVHWLHGAPGRNLTAEFDVLLSRQTTKFEAFPGFVFDDPSRTFSGEVQPLFEGTTDSQGRADVRATLEQSGTPSGVLQAVFRGKVFEEGGNFSIDRFSVPYYPYSSYVGLRVPDGEAYSGMLHTDTEHKVNIATVNVEGGPISRKDISIKLYKLSWRWWWDNSFERLANFVEDSYTKVVREGSISTIDGQGTWSFNLATAEYGRYFLRVCDPVSGHCSGEVIYVDEPGWYTRARADGARGGANLLAFTTDKAKYQIGDEIHLSVPAPSGGRALVSLESGSGVIQSFWHETVAGDNQITLEAGPEMAPNAYVHVSLIQPHAQTQNDLPMRLYGVTSVEVEDPGTRLHPEIDMPGALIAGEPVSIRISERDDKPMTYTVAVVDEGLLDLTRFRTPDAWSAFYSREALGVRTWDVYDDVMGAFGARLERFITIGGDDEIRPSEMDPIANRFKPVVKSFGPFTLEGGTQEIAFEMPQYIGSVRTMVVAGNGEAYGKTEKTSVVKKPLMILTTLPRVLGPDEKVGLPVTVFAGDEKLEDVEVSVRAQGPLKLAGTSRQLVSVAQNSDKTIHFSLQVPPRTGVATVEVTARRGNLVATDVVEIQVRNPNTPITRSEAFVLEGNTRRTAALKTFGIPGSNSAVLEVSSLPPLNLASRMRYLLQYPHGCLEQITSTAFPQLYLDDVMTLSEKERDAAQQNVKAGIESVRRFRHTDGGFGYWPGTSEPADSWSTSYAGHFLIVASQKGYYVPDDLLTRWKSFQRSRANGWRNRGERRNEDLLQAYRLYTLALAGAAELGAMNRLREAEQRSVTASWMLASAYAVIGQPEAARALIQNLPLDVRPYRELGYTYGSDLRDKALILETLVLLGERDKGFEVLQEISSMLADEGRWLSTQETAMSLRAVAVFAGKESRQKEMKFDYRLDGGEPVSIATGLPVAQRNLEDAERAQQLIVENKTDGLLYVRVATTGIPTRGQEAGSRSISARVAYTDVQGNAIDVSALEQGTQFIAEVTVTHPGLRSAYENLALTSVFPAGWEINNLRLQEADAFLESSPFRYQDIRDDRVMTYFNLGAGASKTFRVMLTAAYAGEYYLPGVACEAMYDAAIYARTSGRTISVVPIRR